MSTNNPAIAPSRRTVGQSGQWRSELGQLRGEKMRYRAAGRYRPPPVLHRLLSSAVSALAAHGFSPANTVALEVLGRRSGRLRSAAVVVVDHQGERFIVSLGGESEWVRNVRAAGGKVILRRGKRTRVR